MHKFELQSEKMPSGARWCGTTFLLREINSEVIEFLQGAKQVGRSLHFAGQPRRGVHNSDMPAIGPMIRRTLRQSAVSVRGR